MKSNRITIVTLLFLAASLTAGGQNARVITLEECRQMAVESSNSLKVAQEKINIADQDKKIAASNYLPKISLIGTYQHADADISLLSDDMSNLLTSTGTMAQTSIQNKVTALVSDPVVFQKIMTDPALQKVVAALSAADIASPINAIGTQIGQAFAIDMQNIYLGAATLEQPLFVGGKIIAANRIATYAKQLARSQYEMEERDVVCDIDQAYWQIVSIAAKLRLAESYSELLHKVQNDTRALVEEGMATKADQLSVDVNANEADMLLTKARNGLALSKMLLCKKIGLPLESGIILADENSDTIPLPEATAVKNMEDIFAGRPEIQSLELAQKIYDKKISVTRADFLPQVALTGNCLMVNPNLSNGFQKSFSDIWTAGVMVRIPLFHGLEGVNKVKRARCEAAVTGYKLADAKDMITLQVNQLQKQNIEAAEKLEAAQVNLQTAEENLNSATEGYKEGVVPYTTLSAAQTAWLKARSEIIDAGVELQICNVNLKKAQGDL